jgi:hypothetical protein
MDPDFWLRQWEAFAKAPVACLIFLALGLVGAWWLRGSIDQGETKGLKEQNNALEQRLKLAGEQEKAAIQAARRLNDAIDAMLHKRLAEASEHVADARRHLANAPAEASEHVADARRHLANARRHLESAQEKVFGTLQPDVKYTDIRDPPRNTGDR